MNYRHFSAAVLWLALSFSTSGQSSSPPAYTLINIALQAPAEANLELPFSGYYPKYMLNEAGQVIGEAWILYDGQFQQRGFIYSQGQVLDLTLPGGFSSYSAAINHAGQVVGETSFNASSRESDKHAFLFTGGQFIDITPPGMWSDVEYHTKILSENGAVTGAIGGHAFIYKDGQFTDLGPGAGYAINNAGYVVGRGETGAFLYRDNQFIDLGTLLGTSESAAYHLNEAGDLVGEAGGSYWPPGTDERAFLYSQGQLIDLTLPGGIYSMGRSASLNQAGQVAGTSSTYINGQYRTHAFLHSNGQLLDLGTLPGGQNSAATDLNEAGQVAGYSDIFMNGQQESHAFLYTGGQMIDLGTLPGGHYSIAADLNDVGQVVGTSGILVNGQLTEHAFIYTAGQMVDLGTLPGGARSWGKAVNNAGQVLGESMIQVSGVHTLHLFLAEPVPASAPSVQIITPANGGSFNEGESIVAAVSVAANGGAIISVTGSLNGGNPIPLSLNGQTGLYETTLVQTALGLNVFSVTAISGVESTTESSTFTIEPVDALPPTLFIDRIVEGPPTQLILRVADAGSGLASIQVVKAVNADVAVPPFARGTLGPVFPVATKIDQSKSASVEVVVMDVAGNVTRGDPVVTTLELEKGGWILQRFIDIPQAESYISIRNGADGLKKITIRVNKSTWMIHLKDNEPTVLDVSTAMSTGSDNIVEMIGHGPPGANALIVIADSPQAPTLDEQTGRRGHKGKIKRVNLAWGRLEEENKGASLGGD